MEPRDRINQLLLNHSPKPFFGSKRTDLSSLRSLFKALAPITTEHPLIRIGPAGDGGYLIPDDLVGVGTCFSPGVNTESRFELQCAQSGMNVFMADASVHGPPDTHPNFHFIKKFVGNYTHDEFVSMADWEQQSQPDPDRDWIMQMDIEGGEYEFLLGMSEASLRRNRILVIEFHNLDYLYDEVFFALANTCFRKILKSHTCIHIHPNNCSSAIRCQDIEIPKIMEFTFYRNDRFTQSQIGRAHV